MKEEVKEEGKDFVAGETKRRFMKNDKEVEDDIVAQSLSFLIFSILCLGAGDAAATPAAATPAAASPTAAADPSIAAAAPSVAATATSPAAKPTQQQTTASTPATKKGKLQLPNPTPPPSHPTVASAALAAGKKVEEFLSDLTMGASIKNKPGKKGD